MQNFDLASKVAAKGERCTGWFRVLVKRAWRRCGNRLNAIFDLAKRCGKGLKLHGGFWGAGRTCFAQILKPSKCRISTWQGRGKGRKVHRRVRVPVQLWKPSKCNIRGKRQYFHLARQGQRAMAKRWQEAKAARKGLGPWWNVLRAGFETL